MLAMTHISTIIVQPIGAIFTSSTLFEVKANKVHCQASLIFVFRQLFSYRRKMKLDPTYPTLILIFFSTLPSSTEGVSFKGCNQTELPEGYT